AKSQFTSTRRRCLLFFVRFSNSTLKIWGSCSILKRFRRVSSGFRKTRFNLLQLSSIAWKWRLIFVVGSTRNGLGWNPFSLFRTGFGRILLLSQGRSVRRTDPCRGGKRFQQFSFLPR